MVVLRIDKSLLDMATLVVLGRRRIMITPDLLALGVVRNMRVGAWMIESVAMDEVRVVI